MLFSIVSFLILAFTPTTTPTPPPPNNSICTCICTLVPRNHFFPRALTLDYYTLPQHKLLYYTFQKHANSEVQKLTDVCVLLSIILEDLFGNRSVLQRVQKVMVCNWWISSQCVCSCVSRFVACDRNLWLTSVKNAIVKAAFELQSSHVFEKLSKTSSIHYPKKIEIVTFKALVPH